MRIRPPNCLSKRPQGRRIAVFLPVQEIEYNYPVKPQTAARLIEINRRFYRAFGDAFAHTRRRIQPGIRRLLQETIPTSGDWLDLGCGSGALAAEWARQGRRGSYTGLDFSPELLSNARQTAADFSTSGLALRFAQADLTDPDWPALVAGQTFDGVLAFAVFHHLPGSDLHHRVLNQVRGLLRPGGLFIHSEWQFQHSPKLWSRRLPWEQAGISLTELDPGDTLLDWRHALPGQAEQVGTRYVHLFSREELGALAQETGFTILDEFESDGQGGRLGLYQVWQVSV